MDKRFLHYGMVTMLALETEFESVKFSWCPMVRHEILSKIKVLSAAIQTDWDKAVDYATLTTHTPLIKRVEFHPLIRGVGGQKTL